MIPNRGTWCEIMRPTHRSGNQIKCVNNVWIFGVYHYWWMGTLILISFMNCMWLSRTRLIQKLKSLIEILCSRTGFLNLVQYNSKTLIYSLELILVPNRIMDYFALSSFKSEQWVHVIFSVVIISQCKFNLHAALKRISKACTVNGIFKCRLCSTSVSPWLL